MKNPIFRWIKKGGYEVSTKGDKRYSALCAILEDGRSIEAHYQCDIKGYQPGGVVYKLGKGKPPLKEISQQELYNQYKSLWIEYFCLNPGLIDELMIAAKDYDYCLSDCFAKTEINQANVIAEIMNDINNVNY